MLCNLGAIQYVAPLAPVRALPENIDTLAGLVLRSSQAARREAVLEPCSEG